MSMRIVRGWSLGLASGPELAVRSEITIEEAAHHTGLSLPVVGMPFMSQRLEPARRREITRRTPGDLVVPRPEKDNDVSGPAIAIYSRRGTCLGYIAAHRSAEAAAMLKAERPSIAVFQIPTPFGCLIRIVVDGERVTVSRPLIKDEMVPR